MRRLVAGIMFTLCVMTYMAFAQDTKPAARDAKIVDPCATGLTPCELDQLKLTVQGLQIENSRLKAELAQTQLQLANVSVMANNNTANAVVNELYKRYGFKPEEYEFKQVDGQWRFVKR